MSRAPIVQAFFDETTFTVSYVVYDKQGGHCVVIDPVLDYRANSGRTSTRSAEAAADFVTRNDLSADWILETHIHADHLTGAAYLKDRLGAKVGIGAGTTAVQRNFAALFNLGPEFPTDGRQFDVLFEDGAEFSAGELSGTVMATPGHTPGCVSYLIGDAVFVGDTLFMPDFGTARCDFPGGDARVLYRSIRKILALPRETRLFVCHDYKAPGRDVFAWETSVGEQRDKNLHTHDGVSEEDFVALRTERDKKLDVPNLLLPSVQVNIRAGVFPPAEGNGRSYIKIPLDAV